MTGYEIIKGNINFTGPERIGIRFDRIAGKGDVYRIFVLPPADKRPEGTYSVKKKFRPQNKAFDEWGCYWESDDETGSDMGQPTNIPLKEIEDLETYVFPDPKAPGRFDGLEEALKEAEEKQLYVQLNSPHCIFERMHFLRGFQDTLMDCIAEPEAIEEMARKLADYQIGIIEEAYRLGKGRIHCYDTTDDWGTQNSLMISPELFREIFKPQYKRIFDKAHACGMDVRFHTDGKVNDILLDIQATMPTGDKKLIEEEVKELVDKWATKDGGMIAVEYGYLNAIGTTKESMLYELECFEKYGKLR